jgi:translation initiation factor 1
MSKKHKADRNGLVYSTDPDFNPQTEEDKQETLPPASQRLRIRLETKHRGGKTATVITGFIGTEEDLESLSKKLKSHCGTGGSAKDGEMIIQGDQRQKVLAWLLQQGYAAK